MLFDAGFLKISPSLLGQEDGSFTAGLIFVLKSFWEFGDNPLPPLFALVPLAVKWHLSNITPLCLTVAAEFSGLKQCLPIYLLQQH